MAIGVTAKLVVKEGHAEEFEALFKELQGLVNEQESRTRKWLSILRYSQVSC